jgi:hypothetical protein
MQKRKGWRLPAVAVAVVSLAVSILVAGPSTADVTTHYYARSENGSDPNMFRCADPANGTTIGWCLVTSQDLNEAPFDPNGPGKNYYPMSRTLGQYSPDGFTWSSKNIALEESRIGRSGFKHLWAPTVRWQHTPTAGVKNNYYLYTPDLTNKNDRLSSKIFITHSTNPTKDFGLANIPGKNVKWVELDRGPSAPNHYISDPDIFVDSSNPGDPNAATYLLWADGDDGTCGGFGIRRMTSPTSVEPYTSQSQTTLVINGLETGDAIDGGAAGTEFDQGLGKCFPDSGGSVNRPYIEGGSIYRKADLGAPVGTLPGNYILVFPAKPQFTPGVCTAPGQPNTDNSVIAYATATSVTGPYEYQGIIMCGSSTEWTNQATLAKVRGSDGRERLMLVYHDGKAAPGLTPRNRQTHSECLYVRNGKFQLTPRSPEGAVSVSGTRQWCMKGDINVVALKSMQTNKYVISRTDQALEATSPRVGLWEEFRLSNISGVNYLMSRNPDKVVQVNRNAPGKPVIARGTTKGEWEGFTMEQVTGQTGVFRIKDKQGFYWRVDSAGKMSAQTTNPSASDKSYWFIKENMWW